MEVSKKNKAVFMVQKPGKESLDIARKWLLLGISALAIAGLFSILLVAARTPGIQNIFPGTNFFHTALVVHVDLSVLVWLVSFSCAMFIYVFDSAYCSKCGVAYYIALAGMIGIALSPFVGEGNPLMNNYVPILQNGLFFIGLALFAAGASVQVAFCAFGLIVHFKNILWHKNRPLNPQLAAVSLAVIAAVIALICFMGSNKLLSVPQAGLVLGIEQYYELLFWGGGHILQITYVAILAVVWLWLAELLGAESLPSRNLLNLVYGLNALLLFPVPIIFNFVDIYSFEYKNFFTQHMRWVAGIIPLIISWFILVSFKSIYKNTKRIPERNSLIFSFILFTVGGMIGFMIEGSNVVIPAHYHGSIVGVTLAFMGITYCLLPQMGYGKIDVKLAKWQPVFYGGGQLMHITGLAWSGGYGALRKTPGAVQSFEGQMGMGLMGLGGLLSVIGGLLFVIVAYKSIFGSRSRA